jgi:transketolase
LPASLKLGRLIVLWDDNNITIDGDTSLSTSEDILARYTRHRLARASATGMTLPISPRALAPRLTRIRARRWSPAAP